MAVADKTMEHDGFFEGVYDHFPVAEQYGLNPENTRDLFPRLGGFDLRSAHPELFGFSSTVNRHLAKLSIGYREKNNLVQIGGQYWHGDLTPIRSLIPDGYTVRYSRVGRGRINRGGPIGFRSEILSRTDQEKSLSVHVLRATVASQLVDEEVREASDDRRWQKIAQIGRPVGNAVLAMSAYTHSYQSVLTGMSEAKFGELQPVEDDDLAEQVFSTVYYWQET